MKPISIFKQTCETLSTISDMAEFIQGRIGVDDISDTREHLDAISSMATHLREYIESDDLRDDLWKTLWHLHEQ